MASKALGQKRQAVAVIGDGGMTAGLAFEALNHLGACGADVIVVYNDNDMSISENVGGLRNLSARLVQKISETAESSDWRPRDLPPASESATHLPDPEHFFAALGLKYQGPVDGHDLGALHEAFEQAKNEGGPQLIHALTVKGRGFEPAEDLSLIHI